MNKKFSLVFLFFFLTSLVFGSAGNIANDIEKVPENDEYFEFRGAVEGLRGLIQEIDVHIFKHSKINFVEYHKEIVSIEYGGTRVLSYRLLGSARDIRKIHSEIKKFLSRWSRTDIWEVK